MSSIFNPLSADYAILTDESNRLKREIPLLVERFRNARVHSLLDVGCGIGSHVIALTNHNFIAKGIDINENMIEAAQKQAAAIPSIQFETKTIEQESLEHPAAYDGIFCIGNTFPQIVFNADLAVVLRWFGTLLKPGGYFLGQMMHADWIRAQNGYCLPVRDIPAREEHNRKLFLRTYIATEATLILSVVKLEESSPHQWNRELYVQPMAFIQTEQLVNSLACNGFTHMQLFEDFSGKPFQQHSSTSLIWECYKQ